MSNYENLLLSRRCINLIKKKMNNNDDNNHNKPHNLPIKGDDPNIRFEKGRLAYEKLLREGRLGEYEKYVELLEAKKRREEEEEEEERNRPKCFKCTKCNQIGPEGLTCERCGDKEAGGVYGDNPLSGEDFANCFDSMIEEANNNNNKK